MSTTATPQEIATEVKAAKIAKLHSVFTSCPALDADELRAVMLALMHHLGIRFIGIDYYRESIFNEEIAKHGPNLNEQQKEDFKDYVGSRHDELIKTEKFGSMETFFFDLTNSTAFDVYARFSEACNKYMVFRS